MSLTKLQRWHFDEELTSKYEVVDMLGGGGMGHVLRARHRQLKRWVAIKLLQQDLKASDAMTRFLREARAAAQIRSVHVAQVMDAGVLRSGQPYIVMEYLEGQDLARFIAARGRLSVAEAVAFTLQALEAIAEAHSLRIVHRDIKPGNLFAAELGGGEMLIKVLDFGLAKTSQIIDTLDPGVTEQGAVLGTPSYMAPEQFVNAQEVDARADIWGIGATLFEMLTGKPPFRGSNLPQLYSAVMYATIASIRDTVPELPEELALVVAKCMMRERDARYTNVADLAAALAPFADESARWQVARIRRVLERARDSEVQNAPRQDAAAAPVDDSGTISANAERSSERSATQTHSRKLHGIGLVLALIVCVVSGASVWGVSASRRAARPESKPVPISVAPRSPSTPPPPAQAVAIPASVSRAAPEVAPTPTSSMGAGGKSKKPRRKQVAAANPLRALGSLYEKYP